MTLTYRGAGVDRDAAAQFTASLPALARRASRPEVLAGIGGFGALVSLPQGYREPVLVSGADGVGTKLLVALEAGRHDTIGIDLVAMCVNDVAVCGAEPLFFLDYLGCGRLDPVVAEQVMAGIVEGCARAGCALVGGETAQLPGLHAPDRYELAGFAVGVAERSRLVDGKRVAPGDRVVGIASNGLHSNGYSLVRRILFEEAGLSLDAPLPGTGRTVANELLRPTHIYSPLTLDLCRTLDVHALAHITGGGLPGNLARPFPAATRAVLDVRQWPMPELFRTLQRLGPVTWDEMARTFNLGVGLCAVVAEEEVPSTLGLAAAHGFDAWEIGAVEASDSNGSEVVIEGLD
jgi:phosphoribosylformylglycinamidine cyclo-ligase